MAHGRRVFALAVLFSFACWGVVGAQPTEEERLRQRLLELQRLQKKQEVPKDAPKAPEKLAPAQPGQGGLPAGAVARLGQTRLRHADKPTCVVFAPDGKSFITGAEDGTIRAWSVATGDQLNMLQKSGLGVSALKLTNGGKRLAAQFGTEGLLRFIDTATFHETGSMSFLNRFHFTFSEDGKYVATSDTAGNVVVAEVEDDLPKLELTGADVFEFRPDGKAIATGDAKGNVTIQLVTGGKPTFTVKHNGPVAGLAYSPNGSRLAVGWRGTDGTDIVRVYEPGKGKDKPVAEITGMNLPRSWVGSDALALGNGAEAGVYDLAKKEWTGRVKGIAGEFAVSPDGTKLAATGSGLRVRLYELSTGKQVHAENDSFPDPSLLVGSADGKTLFLLTTDTAYLWTVGAESAKPAGTLPGRAVAASASRAALVVATPNAVLLYAKFEPTEPLPEKRTHTFKNSAGAKAVAVSADGTRVAWATKDGKVIVADAADEKERRELPMATSAILALSFNPAGNRLATLGRDPHLRLWDVSADRDEPKEVWKARVQRGQKGAIVFSPDGKLVTAVSTAQLWVYDAGDKGPAERDPDYKFERYTDQGAVQHASFTPDGRYLILGSTGAFGRVELWDLATRGLVRAFTTGYGGTSRLCVFPDGTRAASAGAEEAVTVWDLTARAGKPAPKPAELTAAWADLESSDAAVAYPAVKVLAAAGNKGAEVIARGTKDMVTAQQKISEWIEDLGSQTFSIREIAARELVAQGARALPAVMAATAAEDPELRDRAKDVMKKLEAKGVYVPAHGLAGDSLRLVRAVQALEEIGTPEAAKLLDVIAATGGKPGADAKAALRRLKRE
jgi:WD40 repeat protein